MSAPCSSGRVPPTRRSGHETERPRLVKTVEGHANIQRGGEVYESLVWVARDGRDVLLRTMIHVAPSSAPATANPTP